MRFKHRMDCVDNDLYRLRNSIYENIKEFDNKYQPAGTNPSLSPDVDYAYKKELQNLLNSVDDMIKDKLISNEDKLRSYNKLYKAYNEL